MKKELGREVYPFEVFERMHKKKRRTGEFVDNKSKRVSEKYREKQNSHDQSSHPSFDLASWGDVAGRPTKGRVYGYGRDQHFERARSGSSFSSSNEMISNQIDNELSKEIEEMRATSKKMAEEIVESNKKLELVMMESKLREDKLIEDARQREEDLREMVRKMIQEVGYTNHLFAGGSG